MNLYKSLEKDTADKLLISIIIPVYNAEKYIKRCLLSVQNQTYQNLEIIIINDGSQDQSVNICQEIAKKDSRISFYSQNNKGVSSARNYGLKLATGDYVYFLDSDDYIIPTCIEKLVSVLKKYPFTDIIQGRATGWAQHDVYNKKHLPDYSCNRKWIKRTMLHRKPIPFTPWNKLVRLDLIHKHQLYFIKDILYEDIVWNYDMAKYISSIAFCFDKTYIYNSDNPDSIMHLGFDSHSWLIIINHLIQSIDPFCKRAQHQLILHFLRRTYRKSEINYRTDLMRLFHQMAQKCTFTERLGIYYFFFTQKNIQEYIHQSLRRSKT
jgi:glycosyltransferase involved in cell wall biosynthesis